VTNKKDAGLIDPTNVTSKFLADCLAMTPQGVLKLFTERVIRNNGRRARYELTTAIPQYIGSLRGSGAAEAKAKLAVQQERKLRLQNDAAAGRLVKVDDAAEAFRTYCLIWRSGVNSLPRRLANQLANEDNPAVIQKVLANEFRELFETMESGLQDFFASNGQAFSVTETGPNSEGPPAKKNARRVGRPKKNTATRNRRTGKVAK